MLVRCPCGQVELEARDKELLRDYRLEGAVLPNDAPSFKAFPPRFIARLLWSRLAMLLRL
jgi:hypothetical protein